ncbi:MAG: SDR family oxidoreductase [Holophagales bacterium]|nr:SDR family oxidoreductase [Holophagales bacterium]
MSTPFPDLRGRVAVVSGGTRGIGRAVALGLAASGARLVLGYRADAAAAEETARACEALGAEARTVAANLVHPEEARALVAAAGDRVDALVHSAALGSFKPLLDVKPAQWDLTLAVNARAFLLLARAASERMPDGGRLVALSSLGGSRFIPEYGAIGPSKAALESVVRTLAVELGPRRILVNARSRRGSCRPRRWGSTRDSRSSPPTRAPPLPSGASVRPRTWPLPSSSSSRRSPGGSRGRRSSWTGEPASRPERNRDGHATPRAAGCPAVFAIVSGVHQNLFPPGA